MSETNFKSDVEAVDALANKYQDLRQEIGKVIVGQDEVFLQRRSLENRLSTR